MKNFKNRIKNYGRVYNMEVMFFIPASVGPLRKDDLTRQRAS